AVRKDQSFLDRDPLPNLDFSYFNPWLDTAFQSGLRRLMTNAGTVASVALPSERVAVWFWREVHRYVVSRGFRPEDVFMKVWDETPTDRIPSMARAMEITGMKNLEARPRARFQPAP
ncbi:MAG: hypothetical protein HY360_06460, partial [Verrucomicrobia bacterium]|nr:hypothetical protein [Verrucomicrobiota bacterium]